MNITNLPTLPDSAITTPPAQHGGASHGATVRSLGNALSNGDLQGASQAYAAIQQRIERVTQAANTQDTQSTSPRAESFQQLGSALQSGNLQQAQQAFSQWRQGGNASTRQNATTDTGGQSGGASSAREKLLEPPPPKRHFFPRMVSPGVGGSLGGSIDIKV